MPDQPVVVAFDVDPDSLRSLRQAFPGWNVQEVVGATAACLIRDWYPDAAQLLVIGAREPIAEAFTLCRGLRSQAGRWVTPLIVLVPTDERSFIKAALDAGADSCLVLPVHPKELARAATRAGRDNQPGRHTLNLNRAQIPDRWRDDGGEA